MVVKGSRHVELIDYLSELPSETEWLEFKRNRHVPEQLGQYLSALANGACVAGKPTGYLIFGVDDETHQVVGHRFRSVQDQGEGQPGSAAMAGSGPEPEYRIRATRR